MDFDVIVIGGGAAGLSAALVLGRSRRAVLVVDEGNPRNAPSNGVHNYLGLEGVAPHELLRRGREEVARYGVTLVDCRVSGATRIPDGFSVALADGRRFTARRLLVATGLVDDLPDIPGLARRWGRDVLHCPYCHGWEVRDRRVGVLASGPLAVHQAQLFRQLSDRVTLFQHTGPVVSAEDRAGLAARGIEVVAGTVEAVEVTDDRLSGLQLHGDRIVPLDALVVAPRLRAHDEVVAGLGLVAAEREVGGHVLWSALAAEPNGSTSVPGVWVAGNVTDAQATVAAAGASGVTTAGALNADLVAEDVRRALAAAP
ncbi:NAD(P)/FAD-dependent oxidoreductase [Actinophytocola xanthii]|uniref:Thioredoxin reductase n=1 Tax=Actinophytocola xanthii TaxID=1912961 RepID=A0A1Q8C8Y5_9PSEU|nr:NAD(P)/FAD-dependent oxidoreductase [Actinophytocola xanthii]OLF10829.1 thioredoxin reductase [Actinophytocola xanthii]